MVQSSKTKVCFRNDDVNTLDKELIKLTKIFMNRCIPITHAVEPGNVTTETINWLKKMKKDVPDLIEIVQHGWDHANYGKEGEFGDNRSYEEQYNDLKRGKEKMDNIFGKSFFQMITIPRSVYNSDTIKAADLLKYKVVGGHYNYCISRRIFYFIGHILGKGQLLGRHISNHLNYYPGSNMFEIDTAISFIKNYFGYLECEMLSEKEILEAFKKYQKYTNVVIFLLHHRFHRNERSIELVKNVLDKLKKQNNIIFTNYSSIYKKYA